MRTVAIAQARMGSSRLPGKVLMPLGGKPAILQTIERLRAMRRLDDVLVATTDTPADDVLTSTLAHAGVNVHRGDEHDVLARYLAAARAASADVIVRVTCDCPLLDPAVCDAVVELRTSTGADYASNVERPEWPHGLDCEVVTRAALETSAQHATAEEREHVTLSLRRANDVRRVHLPGPGGTASALRWTLDYPEDYDHLRAIFDLLAPGAPHDWRHIQALMARHPELQAINAARVAAERRARG